MNDLKSVESAAEQKRARKSRSEKIAELIAAAEKLKALDEKEKKREDAKRKARERADRQRELKLQKMQESKALDLLSEFLKREKLHTVPLDKWIAKASELKALLS
jgi:hypothetical protein